MASAGDLVRGVAAPNQTYVLITEDDFAKIVSALGYLKGWSMHTENGEYEDNAASLVRHVVTENGAPETFSTISGELDPGDYRVKT